MAYNGCDDYATHHLWEFVIHSGWTTGWHVCKRCERSVNCDCDHNNWIDGCRYSAAMKAVDLKAWNEQVRKSKELERNQLYQPNGKLQVERNNND